MADTILVGGVGAFALTPPTIHPMVTPTPKELYLFTGGGKGNLPAID